jgi:hypothetical protein
MKRILWSLLVATLPFGSILAETPKSKNAKVTVVYQHELPNVPGKSIKGVLVEYGPGGYSPGHTHAKSAFIYATVLEGAIQGGAEECRRGQRHDPRHNNVAGHIPAHACDLAGGTHADNGARDLMRGRDRHAEIRG